MTEINWYDDPVTQLKAQLTRQQWDLDHRLSVMGMKRAWQESQADNVDATHPLLLNLYIPPDTKLIKRAYLRLKLQNFRSYGTGAAATEAVVPTSEPGVWTLIPPQELLSDFMNLNSDHSHGGVTGPGGADSHTHSISDDGSHAHSMYSVNHTHDVTVPEHAHDIVHGIYEGTAASDVTVTINGTDRTTDLGGPFNADQDSLDITKYLTATGWNSISLGSGTLGRIHATIFVEIYLP